MLPPDIEPFGLIDGSIGVVDGVVGVGDMVESVVGVEVELGELIVEPLLLLDPRFLDFFDVDELG